MTLQQYKDREYYVASLVKLVAKENVDSICRCARNIQAHFEDVDEIDNSTVYEAYCDCEEEEVEVKV